MENWKDFLLQRPTCKDNDMYLDLENPQHPYGTNAASIFDCRNYTFFTKDAVMLPFKCLQNKEYDYEDHKSNLFPDFPQPPIITDLESNIQDPPLRSSSSTIIRFFKDLLNRFLTSRIAARNFVVCFS